MSVRSGFWRHQHDRRLRHAEPRLRHDRGGRRRGQPHALRGIGAREAPVLPGEPRQLPDRHDRRGQRDQRQHAPAVLHAADAAPDGVRKVGQLVRRTEEAGVRQIKSIVTLPSDDLGLALGRSNVIHAALLGGSAAGACLKKLALLGTYRVAGTADRGSALPVPDTLTSGMPQDETE